MNTKQTESIGYNIADNQVLLRANIQMDTEYGTGKFTKELLTQVFFVWLNKDYYLNN